MFHLKINLILKIGRFKKEMWSEEQGLQQMFQQEKKCWEEYLMPWGTQLTGQVLLKPAKETGWRSKPLVLFRENPCTNLCKQVSRQSTAWFPLAEDRENLSSAIDKLERQPQQQTQSSTKKRISKQVSFYNSQLIWSIQKISKIFKFVKKIKNLKSLILKRLSR